MQLFYTGASTYQAIQNDPYQSLGGYISSSPVLNNALNNIFGDVSGRAVQKKQIETRGLILRNTLGVDCTDVVIGYELPSQNSPNILLEIAFVSLSGVTPMSMEKINNREGSPIFATFENANIIAPNVDNSIDIGSLANDAVIGIWLRLTIQGSIVLP